MWKGILRWLFVSVSVGLLPVGLNLVLALITEIHLSLSTLLGKGELLMLAAGLSIGAVVDLTLSEEPSRIRTAAIWTCVAVAVCAVGVYGMVLTARTFSVEIVGFWVAVVSLVPYTLSVLVSSGCTIAAKRRD